MNNKLVGSILLVINDAADFTSINFFNPKIMLCLFYVGAVSNAAAFVMWNKGLTMVSTSVSGLFYYYRQ